MAEEGNSLGNLMCGGDGEHEIPEAMWDDWKEDEGSQTDSEVVPPELWDDWDKGAKEHLVSAEEDKEEDKAKDGGVFAKPKVPGLLRISRSQVNELCWAIRHLKKEQTLAGEVKPGFWLRYARAMKFLDVKTEVKTLSNFSPGVLQKMFEIIAPIFEQISKEVFRLQKTNKKLNIKVADEDDHRIY